MTRQSMLRPEQKTALSEHISSYFYTPNAQFRRSKEKELASRQIIACDYGCSLVFETVDELVAHIKNSKDVSEEHEDNKQSDGWDDDAFYEHASSEAKRQRANKPKKKRSYAMAFGENALILSNQPQWVVRQPKLLSEDALQPFFHGTAADVSAHLKRFASVLATGPEPASPVGTLGLRQ
ncbi:hypothetical protein LTR12_000460 [Friedmanniomyces endolithicus]|nr:hypothetical protein LTR74_013645 [Friedmanniomyces endolithicus]KAK1825171.1 hypothetical protein LTR12_000460 [Friedmanniomyces endolithicus]